MHKKPLNLFIDESLIRNARDRGLILSRFLERSLQDYLHYETTDSIHHLKKQKELVGLSEFESESLAPKALLYGEKQVLSITEDTYKQYLDVIEINGICNEWKYSIDRCILQPYFRQLNWKISFSKTLDYLKTLKNKHTLSYYRKHVYQIRKFLEYNGVVWASKLNPPPEPQYIPKRISSDAIQDTISNYHDNEYYLQVKAIILLGTTSGMRAEELYQLTLDDINLDTRSVMINHNPNNGQSTKTKRSRISFFTDEARHALTEYIEFYQNNNGLKCLFSQTHVERLFRNGKASIQVKDLRKYFSQIWDRNGGATSIKKILMGHSLKGDVDLMHYNAQSPEDLKKIYDKVMGHARSGI